METHEGGKQYEFVLDAHVDFFSKAGSQFTKKKSFYGNEESALSLFQRMWVVDKELAFKLLMWLRDARGGAGNRSGAREIYTWLAKYGPEWLLANMEWLPEIGRWDDLKALFGTELEAEISKYWASHITANNVLAAKWADRSMVPLQKALRCNEHMLRKTLAKVRKQHIVEHKMCHDMWKEINYPNVPSVAMSRYTKAFTRHDEERFTKFKEKVKKGETKIHASVLFPHDCVRTVMHGDAETGELQFNALPNYLEKSQERIMVICDTSASMNIKVSGSVQAVHISQGMALYCSAKIPKDNPFHKKFMGFSCEGHFVDWNEYSFTRAIKNSKIFNGAVGSTHIGRALDTILTQAKYWNLKDEQLPSTLLIISDMQFHRSKDHYGMGGCDDREGEIPEAMKRWADAGFTIPKVIYWNTSGYAGSPDVALKNNVGFVSGFSPAILKAIFNAEDFTPKGIMLKALKKYKINIP